MANRIIFLEYLIGKLDSILLQKYPDALDSKAFCQKKYYLDYTKLRDVSNLA